MRVAVQRPPARPSRHGRQIQNRWIRRVRRIRRCQTHQIANRGICQESVIRAQRGVGDGPLTEPVVDGFIVLPLVRVGGVVHADFKVLRAAEEKVAVVGELSRVASRVVMDDFVCCGAGDEALHVAQ